MEGMKGEQFPILGVVVKTGLCQKVLEFDMKMQGFSHLTFSFKESKEYKTFYVG